MIVQNLSDRLRPLVGSKGWDYCVLWKFSDDQRYIELMDCCCAGTENLIGSEHVFEFPVNIGCRDVIVEHPRIKSCDLLLQLPSSMPIDSGIYAEASLTNQIKWLDYSSTTDSSTNIVIDESVSTRVLIPIAGGLIELLATKQVDEDQNVINFITAQLGNMSIEEETAIISEMQSKQFFTGQGTHENLNFPPDCDSMSFMHNSENIRSGKEDQILENDHMMFSMIDNENMQFMEGSKLDQKQQNNSSSNVRGDSISDCSDQDDVVKYRRRTGKPQSKNLVAERKRRQKLNDRLYALRALVPKISKLDRAAILGDAIEFVKDLQSQAKELQDELEENSDEELDDDKVTNNGMKLYPKCELPSSSDHQFQVGNSSSAIKNTENLNGNKGQQMEAQVEVCQIDGNEFNVKVFCEHKTGGFYRLMEALTCLGLQVTNVNVTSFRGLVSNVLQVERKEMSDEQIQVDHLRDSLLELTKPIVGSSTTTDATEMQKALAQEMDYHQHQLLQNHHYDHHRLHHFHA